MRSGGSRQLDAHPFCDVPGKMNSSSTPDTTLSPGLHIIAPGICGPLAETQSLQDSKTLDGWIKTLSKSQRGVSSSDVHDVISHLFNLEYEGDFPSAALTLLAHDLYDPEMFYMHADPVHLQADMDQAILTPAEDLQIKSDDADILCDVLDQHFSQDGLHFFRLSDKQWFVSGNREIRISTTALHNAIARNVNFLLPESTGSKSEGQAHTDQMNWKQIFTESQMLLHSHELNDRRENEGLQSINSLWFHGTGSLPIRNRSTVDSVCSDDKLFAGLVGYLNEHSDAPCVCQYRPLPEMAGDYIAEFLQTKHSAVNVLHLPQLEHLVNYSDTSIWENELKQLLDRWLYPLLTFCRKNNVRLTLYPCTGSSYQFSKYDTLRFWKRGSLDQYVSCYR